MNAQALFVVVREDRHLDPEISVHSTRALADAAVDEFITRYATDRYEWEETPIDGWERYVETDIDDGPSARIEVKILDGAL